MATQASSAFGLPAVVFSPALRFDGVAKLALMSVSKFAFSALNVGTAGLLRKAFNAGARTSPQWMRGLAPRWRGFGGADAEISLWLSGMKPIQSNGLIRVHAPAGELGVCGCSAKWPLRIPPNAHDLISPQPSVHAAPWLLSFIRCRSRPSLPLPFGPLLTPLPACPCCRRHEAGRVLQRLAGQRLGVSGAMDARTAVWQDWAV